VSRADAASVAAGTGAMTQATSQKVRFTIMLLTVRIPGVVNALRLPILQGEHGHSIRACAASVQGHSPRDGQEKSRGGRKGPSRWGWGSRVLI
jgi:hypothetical protein